MAKRIPRTLGLASLAVLASLCAGQAASSPPRVVDLVGYFAPPVVTPLQCVDTVNTTVTLSAGTSGTVSAVACAAGYTPTATNCGSTVADVAVVSFQNGTCTGKNNSAGSAAFRASRTCCRIPGR